MDTFVAVLMPALIVYFILAFCVTLTLTRKEPEHKRPYVCNHRDSLCDKYGCPDDPEWIGDHK